MSEPLIEISHVSLRREDRTVLSDVSLRIDKGDFLAITGPNGGGKTTLLRIILGLIKPTEGSVHFFDQGKPVDKLSIGYLPQKNHIDSHFPITVEEVVASGLLGLRSLDKAERQQRIEETLGTIELTDLRQRPIGRLSGGQLQRALLGRALISHAQLLVLDEPLSYIDKHFESHLYDIIESCARHSTILLVSHEMSRIASIANRHCIIDRSLTECSAHHHFVHSDCD